MYFAVVLLGLSALTAAIPNQPFNPTSVAPLPIPTYSPPYPETCPASTPIKVIKTITTTEYQERHCPSFYTQVDTPAPWSSCSFNTKTCTRLACLALRTISQPCITDACCTRTATDTSFANCPRSCPTGCATSWTIVTKSCSTPRSYPAVTAG
ncbi:hypothetical protein B0J11DRAFT_251600 [Dendryphion nanum]|uniref:Uncharacterized protein n=1 Tax=Dendryphion nanum TaxID=256645 RepID=A0A9P9E5Q2_9PLEO|nr:hypothetical protein B0J11DRAFT_251600 [Dendryphion nanum]